MSQTSCLLLRKVLNEAVNHSRKVFDVIFRPPTSAGVIGTVPGSRWDHAFFDVRDLTRIIDGRKIFVIL